MKKIIVVIAAILGMASYAAPVRSILGAQGAINKAETSGGWKNPYITDGLIAMWDGEWNAGPGKHNDNATRWIDLTGNGHDFIMKSPYYKWYSNRVDRIGSYLYAGSVNLSPILWTTVEIAATTNSSGHMLDLGYPSVNLEIMHKPTPNNILFLNGNLKWVWHPVTHSNISCFYDDNKIVQKCYIQGGVVQDFGSGGSQYSAMSGSQEGVVRLGHGSNSWGYAGGWYNIRFYNRELTEEEVQHNYLVDKERFNLP